MKLDAVQDTAFCFFKQMTIKLFVYFDYLNRENKMV